jgi:hypothetical protein
MQPRRSPSRPEPSVSHSRLRPPTPVRRIITAVVTVLLVLGAAPAIAASPTAASPSPRAGTRDAAAAPQRSIVLRPAVTRMPASWKRAFVIPYGEARTKLGVGLEGDGEGLVVGPNYGAQGPDGSWWFLDTHKFRLARYSPKGAFRQQLAIPKEHLVQGQYFPHQFPRVMNDGTFLASALVGDGTNLLRARHGRIDTLRLNREAAFRTDDGRKLYGFDWEGPMVEADPKTGKVRDTTWFRTRRGDRYRVTLTDSRLRLVLPDAKRPVDRTWSLTTKAGKPIIAQVQVASGTDGRLHLFLTGFEDRPGAPDLTGYTTISPHGRLGPLEPTLTPFGPGEPGSPSQLGVRPKNTTPWLMFVREDGVHVYQRPSVG